MNLSIPEWFKARFTGTGIADYQPSLVFASWTHVKTQVREALHTLILADEAYNLGIWPTSEEREKWLNDLAVFLAFDNLDSVSLQFLRNDKTVEAEVKICFGQRVNGRNAGAPRGKEVPVVDKKLIAAHRVIVNHKDGNLASQYRHLLRMSWSSAETLRRRTGDEFGTAQARKTAGRQAGSIFASADSRHELIVTRPIGNKGFGFADCPSLGLTGIFLHERYLCGVRDLRLGQRVVAQLIQVPTGIQAREVRAI